MTYPLSSPVSVGTPTEADQYNNLRKDALFIGEDPAESGSVRDILLGRINFTRINATQFRLNASETWPAAVTINGVIHAVTENLIKDISAVDYPDAGRYSIYAVASGSGFTLEIGTDTPTNGQSIGTLVWTGDGIIPNTINNNQTREINRIAKNLQAANGRLTYSPGIPIPSNDITNAETLFFTPYNGNEIGLYLGGEWELFSFTELSMNLSGMQREIPYDIFIGANKSGLFLFKNIWGSPSARLTDLSYQDGVPVLTTDRSLRYLGTIALNAAGQGEDSETGRLLYNQYNQVARHILSQKNTGSTVLYENTKWVPGYGDNTPEVRLLVPNPETDFEMEAIAISTMISDSDAGYSRGVILGICQEMVKTSPYTGNTNCAPVFCHSFGNSPMTCKISNSGSTFRGYHTYTMAFWTNYTFALSTTTLGGEMPGIIGKIMA